MTDDTVTDHETELRELITRLARPHRSGGHTVERASLLAAGDDFDGALRWIEANGGEPEYPAAAAPRGGLFGSRETQAEKTTAGTPQRFILPAAALQRS